jgi:hypothetical protein
MLQDFYMHKKSKPTLSPISCGGVSLDELTKSIRGESDSHSQLVKKFPIVYGIGSLLASLQERSTAMNFIRFYLSFQSLFCQKNVVSPY